MTARGAAPTAPLTASTAACTKPAPSAPANLNATATATNAIQFTWDATADPSVTNMAYTLTGPLVLSRLPRPKGPGTSVAPQRLVCGESYRFDVWWIDDEGRPSDVATTTAQPLACPAPDTAGPAPTGLHVTGAGSRGFTLAWDASPASVLGARVSSGTPGVTALEWRVGNTPSAILNLPVLCGQTYDLRVAWVYASGAISPPASVAGDIGPCSTPPSEPALPPQPNVDSTPPSITVKRTRLRPNKRGVIVITVRCGSSEERCSGKLTLRAGPNSKRIRLKGVLGRGRFDMQGGAADDVRIVLGRRVRSALAKARTLRLTLAINATDAAGNHTRKNVTMRLRA